ncbi:uncharacterized protein LOC113852404 isoform X2 [Abrus precatorius]|uniref:Uncharacterized protein LOC113852404 isoform X2 n=1 Tax=Abrus precatorius TaxID=3816 RepID=A0A8B8K5R0_ABRPR|nr:uncharacterized protein LOC113852404 isoform X2 [Abrus precatorius]
MQMQVSSVSLQAKVGVCVKSQQHTNPATINDHSSSAKVYAPKWTQKTITLPPHKRGCHLITSKIVKEIGQELSGFKCGLAHLFLHHTSASLTINENCDYDVRDDTETFLNRIVPEGPSAPWKHTIEGYRLQMENLTWGHGRRKIHLSFENYPSNRKIR